MDILGPHKKNQQTPEESGFLKEDLDNTRKLFPKFGNKKAILEWEAEEFSYYEKSRRWFIFGGVVFFLLVGYFMLRKQIMTSLTFLLLGVTIYLFSLKKPRSINCSISYHDITVDNIVYPFKELQSFWIFYEPPDFKAISFKHKKPYLPYIQIPLGNKDPMEVRKTLLEFLPEDEQEELFSDRLARYLRF